MDFKDYGENELKAVPAEIQTQNKGKWLRCVELVAAGGLPQIEIIKETGVARDTFYRWVRSEEFRSAVMIAGTRMFGALAPKALQAVEQSLASRNERVRLDAAKLVLDRTLGSTEDTKPPIIIQVNYV